MAPIQRVCFDTRSKVWILFGRQYTAQLLPPRSQSIAHLSFPFSPLSEASPSCVCLTPFFSFRAVSALRGRGGRKPTELVCPQLPLRGGQWVWWEGSNPPTGFTDRIHHVDQAPKGNILSGTRPRRVSISQPLWRLQPKAGLFLAAGVWDAGWSLVFHFRTFRQPLRGDWVCSHRDIFNEQISSLTWSVPKSLLLYPDSLEGGFFLLFLQTGIALNHPSQHSKKS